jgi:hypothetical protein
VAEATFAIASSIASIHTKRRIAVFASVNGVVYAHTFDAEATIGDCASRARVIPWTITSASNQANSLANVLLLSVDGVCCGALPSQLLVARPKLGTTFRAGFPS